MSVGNLERYGDNFPANYLINEYNQLFSELRDINTRTVLYAKAYFTVLLSYIVYTLLGFQFFLSAAQDRSSVGVLYGGFGAFLSILMYFLLFMAQRQYCTSRKHKIRYWKSINSLRQVLVETLPNIEPYILLPSGENSKIDNNHRPRVSTGESNAVFFSILISYLFLVILFCFFWILFEGSLINIYHHERTFNIVDSQIFKTIRTPFIMLAIFSCSFPRLAFWHYYKNFEIAKKIRIHNPYPSFSTKHFPWFIKYFNVLLKIIIISIYSSIIFYERWPTVSCHYMDYFVSIKYYIYGIFIIVFITTELFLFFYKIKHFRITPVANPIASAMPGNAR